ncbi:hypothetical protein ACE1SV_64490 [Streptomyces sp. E-15]
MDFQPVERASEAFQQSLTAEEIGKVCRRAFGGAAAPVSAVELGTGMYNNVYRVTVAGQERPVILRVAPEPGRQFRSERQLMRNEYASVPYLAVITPLMPRVITADWSQEVIGRDWMVQSLLDGIRLPSDSATIPVRPGRRSSGSWAASPGPSTTWSGRTSGPSAARGTLPGARP